MSTLPRPLSIVDCSLADDIWYIRTDDPNKKREPITLLRFDAVVAPNKVRLNGPGLELDLITAKVFAARGLMPGIGWSKSGKAFALEFRALLTMIRWRIANGVASMANLSEEWFLSFVDDLRDGGIDGLTHMHARVDDLLADVRAGRCVFSTYLNRRFDWEDVAMRLGLSDARSLSRGVQAKIIKHLEEHDPALHAAAMQTSRISEASEPVVEQTRLTDRRIAILLAPWERLADFRRFMGHDPIAVQAFDSLRSRWSMAAALGREVETTKDIPVETYAVLLDRALRWVLLYSEHVLALLEKPEAQQLDEKGFPQTLASSALRDEVGAPWPMVPGYNSISRQRAVHGELDLRTAAFRLLPAACLAVIGAFSMRRREEIGSLRAPCISYDEDGAWLSSFIEKTTRDIDRLPVPKCVAVAVKVLEGLSARARSTSGQPWLFVFKDLTASGRLFNFDTISALNEFARFVRVPTLPDGSVWHFAPHQLRRAGCITYIYRFRMGSYTALSDFLRHFDPNQTRRYLETLVTGSYQTIIAERDASEAAQRVSAEIGAIGVDLTAARTQFMQDVFRRVALGQEEIGGYGGRVLHTDLRALVAEANSRITISSSPADGEQTLDALLIAFVAKSHLEAHPDGHSYCKCTSISVDLKTAECLSRKREALQVTSTEDTAPDLAFAEATVCAKCPHNVQLAENASYWTREAAAHRAVGEFGSGEPLRRIASERAAAFEEHHKRWFSTTAEDQMRPESKASER